MLHCPKRLTETDTKCWALAIRDPLFGEVWQHEESMSMKSITPHTPLLSSKTGVCRGKPIFLFFVFALAEAVLTSTHNLCFEQK